MTSSPESDVRPLVQYKMSPEKAGMLRMDDQRARNREIEPGAIGANLVFKPRMTCLFGRVAQVRGSHYQMILRVPLDKREGVVKR